MSTTMKCVKKALIREEGYPVGTPAPLHVNCACGSKVPISQPINSCETCGTVYDSQGWII